MARVVWRPSATRSLNRIAAYIRRFDPGAAERYTARLIDLGEALAHFPHRGRPTDSGEREMAIVPPYVLRYRVDEDGEGLETVMILDIRHGRQRPVS